MLRTDIANAVFPALSLLFDRLNVGEDVMRQTGDHHRDKPQAILWAKDLLRDPFLILDTETTELDSTGEITQIAVLSSTEEVLMNTFVCPTRPIDEESRAFKVSGISQEMVKGAPTFMDIYEELSRLLSGQTVVIYNSPYDVRLIKQSIGRYGYVYTKLDKVNGLPHQTAIVEFTEIEATFVDAMVPYAIFYGEWNERFGNYKFQKLPGTTHGALADCHAVLTLIHRMAQG